MKSMKIIVAALPLILPICVVAETEKVGDYTWQYFVRDGKAWIGSQVAETAAVFPKPVGEVVVPSELGGYEVFRIDDYTLCDCNEMTKIVIPDCVHQMGASAFKGCSALGNVYLSENLECISSNAFRSCSSLTSILIPPSVEIIDQYAFSDCDKLSKLVWHEGSLRTLKNHVFRNCNALKDIVVPFGVEDIGHNIFLGCHSLTNAIIPNSVTNIGIYAFSYCNHLMSLTLPFIGSQRGNADTDESVFGYLFGVSAYEGLARVVQTCSGTSQITRYIPKSLTRVVITDESIVAKGAFDNCYSLEEIIINEGIRSIGEWAFNACPLIEMTIPNTVTNMGYGVFGYCDKLQSLTLPFVGVERGVKDTEGAIFGRIFSGGNFAGAMPVVFRYDSTNTSKTKTHYLPKTLKSVFITDETIIPYGAFQNCSNLTSVVIGNSVTNIAQGAFSGCGRLESMTLPFVGSERGGVPHTPESVFGYIFGKNPAAGLVQLRQSLNNGTWTTNYISSALTDLVFLDETIVNDGAFYACNMLTNVSLNAGITRIGGYAFRNCTGLKTMVIPEGVELDDAAFRGSGLETVFVPLSVTNMAGWVFESCKSLRLAYVPRRFKGNLGYNTFANCAPDLQIIYYDENMKFFDETLATEDGSSTNIVAVCTNDCRVSFEWKCSCEPLFKNNAYDYLSFEIDGVRQDFICGETGWQTKSYEVSGDGEHTFRWIYQKDEQDSAGEDCGWVKHVVVAPRVTLAFDGGEATDGEAPKAMSFYADDETVTLPGCGTLSLAKHSFAGWSDGEKVYAAGAACPYQKTAQTLTAVWTANTLSAPVITAPETYEADFATVTIAADDEATVYYTLDGSTPVADGTGCRPYQGPFEIEGSATIKAIAVKDDYFDSEVASFTMTRPTWTYGEYLNCPERMFTMGDNTEWVREKGVSDDGYALRSGAITHSQTSRLETVVYGAGTVAFSCKVDGEVLKKIAYDGLAFCVDGVQQGDLMGDNEWSEKSFTVTGDGRHVLSWLYIKDEEGNGGGEDCAWLDNVVWTANDPLPPLDAAATDNDAKAIIGGLSDARLSNKVVGTAAYTAFRNWVDSKGLSHAVVRDAPNAWLSYALDAPGLMAKAVPLASEDVVIESITPSSAATGTFDLVVDIAGAEIGTAARLAEVLGVEGATELNESAFSSEGLNVTLERTASGKVKAVVTPQGSPAAFFVRVKVR